MKKGLASPQPRATMDLMKENKTKKEWPRPVALGVLDEARGKIVDALAERDGCSRASIFRRAITAYGEQRMSEIKSVRIDA